MNKYMCIYFVSWYNNFVSTLSSERLKDHLKVTYADLFEKKYPYARDEEWSEFMLMYSLKSEEWDFTPMSWYLTLWTCQNGTNL